MRTNCQRDESGSRKRTGKSETKILEKAWEDCHKAWQAGFDGGYDEGFAAGVEEAKEQFMQTQLLLFHTGGHA